MHGILRLSAARLPILVAVASVLATVIDAISFIVVLGTDEQAAAKQIEGPEHFFGFLGKLLGRIGPSFSIGIAAFLLAFFIGRSIDDRPREPREHGYRGTSSPAATVAGVLAIVGGAYAALMATTNLLPWTQAIAESDAPGRPAEWLVSLIVLGLLVPSYLLAVTPLVLGVLILRRVMWARYVLVVFFALVGAGLVAWTIGPEASMVSNDWRHRSSAADPTATDVANAFLAVPVSMLQSDLPLYAIGMCLVTGAILWAALRERGSVGSLRECWRALLAIAVHVPFLAAVIFVQVYDMARPALGIGELLGYFALMQSLGVIVMMFFALWALAKDENPFWARLNAWLVVCAPIVISGLGLIASIFQAASLALAG